MPLPQGAVLPVPQWSPPLVGGVTVMAESGWSDTITRQWSPPLVGGVTEQHLKEALQARTPQWSPPLVGGVTP